MDISRTFIVRVTSAPPRVIVDDVREGRRAVAEDLAGVGTLIGTWLGVSAATEGDANARREDSVSPPT